MGSSNASTAAQCSAAPAETSANWPAVFRLIVAAAIVSTLLPAAVYVAIHQPYKADSPLGYNLGLAGGLLMLLLFPYSLRKRLQCLRQFFTMQSWFLFHIMAGLLGPLLVLFHSTFRIESVNGGVALASTLLVTLSGTVGRFFYRIVYRGFAGNRQDLEKLEETLSRNMEERLPEVGGEIRCYLDFAASTPATRWRRAVHFLSLGRRRTHARRRILHALLESSLEPGERRALQRTVDATLGAAQRTAQFSTYERLFALWHVIHIPFLFLLILTSVVHVLAVHAY